MSDWRKAAFGIERADPDVSLERRLRQTFVLEPAPDDLIGLAMAVAAGAARTEPSFEPRLSRRIARGATLPGPACAAVR